MAALQPPQDAPKLRDVALQLPSLDFVLLRGALAVADVAPDKVPLQGLILSLEVAVLL